jgi:hypothetical protein
MAHYWNETNEATNVFEAATRPELIERARTTSEGLDGTSRVDPERFLLLTQESERVARAATVIASAQLLSNGHSARSIVRMLGSAGSASNWASDRLYRQLAPLADKLTAARNAGQPRLAEVSLDVPLNRTEVRTYTFHDVPTGL